MKYAESLVSVNGGISIYRKGGETTDILRSRTIGENLKAVMTDKAETKNLGKVKEITKEEFEKRKEEILNFIIEF